MKAFERSKML